MENASCSDFVHSRARQRRRTGDRVHRHRDRTPRPATARHDIGGCTRWSGDPRRRPLDFAMQSDIRRPGRASAATVGRHRCHRTPPSRGPGICDRGRPEDPRRSHDRRRTRTARRPARRHRTLSEHPCRRHPRPHPATSCRSIVRCHRTAADGDSTVPVQRLVQQCERHDHRHRPDRTDSLCQPLDGADPRIPGARKIGRGHPRSGPPR